MPHASYKLSKQFLIKNYNIQGSALILQDCVFQTSCPFTDTLAEVVLSPCHGSLTVLAC